MAKKRDHPYLDLPDSSFWNRVVNESTANTDIPLPAPSLELSNQCAIATAGSCFAQHISSRLQIAGANILRTERAHPLISSHVQESFFYNNYTARYGNIYTCRQLLQLFQRAYGIFTPEEDAWLSPNGKHYVDPFRPTVTPGGYSSVEELHLMRQEHFRAVRQMFEDMDLLIFTMGLTECWTSQSDGAVLPVCPGVAGGIYDDSKYAFKNLTVGEIHADFSVFLELLSEVNAEAKVILTVSPVHLIATYEPRHVVESSICSKSILRASCDEIVRNYDNVFYFPSYEMAVSPYAQGKYYEANYRSVNATGVDFITNTFIEHFFGTQLKPLKALANKADDFAERMEQACKLLCDEELLDKHLSD